MREARRSARRRVERLADPAIARWLEDRGVWNFLYPGLRPGDGGPASDLLWPWPVCVGAIRRREETR